MIMHQRIDAVPTARSTSATERELPPVFTELHQQRRFRLEQLDEFTADAAEAMATADSRGFRSSAS